MDQKKEWSYTTYAITHRNEPCCLERHIDISNNTENAEEKKHMEKYPWK